MSEQNSTQPSTKQHSSRKVNTASQENVKQAPAAQRPANNVKEGWKAYWEAQEQIWRTEKEVDKERQKYLSERLRIIPNIEQSIFPFKSIKLSRADVEWLLASHLGGKWLTEMYTYRDGIGVPKRGLDLRGAHLEGIDLSRLPLTQLRGGLQHDEWSCRSEEQREAAAIHLEGAILDSTDLTCSALRFAHLEGANLTSAYLGGATLRGAYLQKANLQSVHFDSATNLQDVTLDIKDRCILLADAHWNGSDLTVIDWKYLKRLADEQETDSEEKGKGKQMGLEDYKKVARANRQLGVALRDQGLNEEADYFAYCAKVHQRKVFWFQMSERQVKFRQRVQSLGAWLFSLLLALLSGYGYRIWRILAAYILTVSLFALAYFVLGMHYSPHLPLDQAYLESITAFHGRVFSGHFSLNTPQIWLTALEAIAGLIIEGVFIAMLIQRFFGK